jgi:hypothetical protein
MIRNPPGRFRLAKWNPARNSGSALSESFAAGQVPANNADACLGKGNRETACPHVDVETPLPPDDLSPDEVHELLASTCGQGSCRVVVSRCRIG